MRTFPAEKGLNAKHTLGCLSPFCEKSMIRLYVSLLAGINHDYGTERTDEALIDFLHLLHKAICLFCSKFCFTNTERVHTSTQRSETTNRIRVKKRKKKTENTN